MNTILLKTKLLSFCQVYILDRRKKVISSIATIEESLFEEGKSTAGDKHHTARAMLQIDRENAGKQLQEVERIETALRLINIDGQFETARLGSLVKTKESTYFLSISAGLTTIDTIPFICISKQSPIGQLVLGKKGGDSFHFRGNEQMILSVN